MTSTKEGFGALGAIEATGQPVAVPINLHHERRWLALGVVLIAQMGFTIASAAGGAATNSETLIAARAVQGGFAAVMAPAALSLITVIFTYQRELNKAFAIFGARVPSSAVP